MNPFNSYCSKISEDLRLIAFTHSLISDSAKFIVLKPKKSNKIIIQNKDSNKRWTHDLICLTIEGYDKIVVTNMARRWSMSKRTLSDIEFKTPYDEEKIKEIVIAVFEKEIANLEW